MCSQGRGQASPGAGDCRRVHDSVNQRLTEFAARGLPNVRMPSSTPKPSIDSTHVQQRRLRWILTASLICLGFFALWLQDLAYPALSGDESFVAIMAEQPNSYLFQRLNGDEPHPPLYYLLRRSWRLLVGGQHEFIDRYPSLLIGMVLLGLTFRLSRNLGLKPWLATIVMAGVGLNPQLTLHIREARMYGLMAASLTAAAIATWRFERLPPRINIGLVAGLNVLALLSHYFNSLFIFALGAWGVLSFQGKTRKQWLIAQAITWAAFAVWLPIFGRGFFNPTSLAEGKTWSLILPLWQTLARLATTGTFGYRDRPTLALVVVGTLVLVGAWLAGSLLAPARQRRLLLMAVAGPVVAYGILCWIKPLFHAKYTLPWLVLATVAFGFLIRRWPRLGTGAWAALLALTIGTTWNTVRRPYDPGITMAEGDWLTPTVRDLSRALIGLAGPSDLFAMGTPDAAHCYYSEYYFDRSLGCGLIPEGPVQTLAATESQVDHLLAQHRVVWYLDFYNPAWDPQHVANQAFDQRALWLGNEALENRTLRLYTSADTVRQQARPAAARFGTAAQLEGFWTAHGQAVHLVLLWRSLAEHPPLDAKVFIHLVDADGQLLAQDDGIPVWWTRPLSTWQLDEQLLDVHNLLPPDGTAPAGGSLRVGLYDAQTLDRLPAYDASGARLPDDYVTLPLDP